MKKIVIQRLFQSISELEQAITTAQNALSDGGNANADLSARVRAYGDILHKQRSLATALCGFASLGDWTEVDRHIKLINGLSSMIRDDATEVLRGTPPICGEELSELTLC